jgi:hypothetical protein
MVGAGDLPSSTCHPETGGRPTLLSATYTTNSSKRRVVSTISKQKKQKARNCTSLQNIHTKQNGSTIEHS